MAAKVRLAGRETVLPAAPTPRHPFFLACLDILWQNVHYNRRLLFYESPLCPPPLHPPCGQDDGQAPMPPALVPNLMQKLKSSLALCLVHYSCWCGRIAKAIDPPHRLFIDCNDAGVEFVEASTDMPLSLLARNGFQMTSFFEELCQDPDHKGDCLFSSPLLSIQATLFSDGGLALGIAQSHIVADGQSLWDFMVSWGECSRGAPLSRLPLHDRQRLAVSDPSPERAAWLPVEVNNNEEEKVSNVGANSLTNEDMLLASKNQEGVAADGDKEHLVAKDAIPNEGNLRSVEIQPSASGEKGSMNSTVGTDPLEDTLVQCLLNLSASAIKKLKSEAGENYTSFEVTFAHFWQRTTIARKSPPGESTHFFIPVNCRSRMAPPLPPAYFGNVISGGLVFSTVNKILKEHLSSIASQIHNKVVEVKEEYLVRMMHWLEINNNRVVSARKNFPQGKGHNVASSPRFPVYQVDFGWGKPVAVRAVKVIGDGEMIFFGGHPTSNQGDLEVCIALPAGVLKRLLEDPMFLATTPYSPFATI